MNPNHRYVVSFNGKNMDFTSPYKGLLQIALPATNKDAVLQVTPLDQ
jgi:hypothetical protein